MTLQLSPSLHPLIYWNQAINKNNSVQPIAYDFFHTLFKKKHSMFVSGSGLYCHAMCFMTFESVFISKLYFF